MKYLTMCTYTDDLYSDDCPYKLRNYKLIAKIEKLENENSQLTKAHDSVTAAYEKVGEMNIRLAEELERLKKQNIEVGDLAETLEVKNAKLKLEKDELKEFSANALKRNRELKDENEELKESLRTIKAMDKEEPCERIEKLMEEIHRLTTEYRKLEDENESVQEELLIQKKNTSMLSASFATLEYHKNVLEGEVKQANKILKMLCK